MTRILTLQEIERLNRDVHRLTFGRPVGFGFRPGQATDLALERDGWRDAARPFTFTSPPEAECLEFTIKSYPDRNGVTAQIGRMTPGDQVRIGNPWGAIAWRGPGTFIAGGAGVTPFIAILRSRLAEDGTLAGSRLVFSSETRDDIFMAGEFEAMPGLDTRFHVAEEEGMIDGDFLDREIGAVDGIFYLCGPPPMEAATADLLRARGVPGNRIVTEG